MNMKDNRISNISFKSNIRFISAKEYETMAKSARTTLVSEMWNLSHVRNIDNKITTKRIKYCVAGTLNDNRKSVIFHLYPDLLYNSKGKKFKNLTEFAEMLRAMSKENSLKGLVIGGVSKPCDFDKGQYSLKLLNYLKKALNKSDRKNFSIFFAQNSRNPDSIELPQSAFYYIKSNDTYYVNCQEVDKNDKLFELLDKDSIRNHFDLIQIADKDKVYVGLRSNDEIPATFWNKNSFAKK